MIRLGPFELSKTIGAGGMGEIWRAIHVTNGTPVAIKVLNPAAGEDLAAFQESFLHEVRLVAGLGHRNVVMALDAGSVPQAADDASGGRLHAGSPFLAMELAGGGSLAGRKLESFTEVRHVLVQLLDGLAHAHAHGIVHRDVKPGNLLVASERTEIGGVPADLLSARIVVTDFGIGGHRERRDVEDVYATGAPVGTPNYMAPEQIRAQWRDHGPWTDLYAVGCLAWQLVTGSTPFRDPNPVVTLAGHLKSPPPTFLPHLDVPGGFEGWLRRLLEKDPGDRFAFAADARRALVGLGDAVPGSGRARQVVPLGDLPTVLHGGGRREEATAPHTSQDRPRDEVRRDFRLEGAGLGLFGLRAVPLMGRRVERDAIWRALADVQTSRRARLIVLRGPSGTGKSRLVEWLSRAAHEEGAALTLKAVLGPSAGADPVAQLADAAVRCDGLSGPEALDRVEAFLGDDGRNGIAEILAQLAAPAAFADAAPLGRRETHAAAEVLLRRVAGTRVCVVWLEDAHRSTEALFLARRLLESATPLPALVVVTAQEEELAERPDEAAFLQSVVAAGGATELIVGPLPSEDHHELVQVLLGLEGSLAQRIEERTQGNPLFAVQLVGHLVSRGLLAPGARGFSLKPGAALDIPDDLLAVWQEHADRLLSAFGAPEARALELAAVFALELRQSDHEALCAIAGLPSAGDALGEAMRRRLVQPLPGRVQRWAFVHGMFREVLIRRTKARGDWAASNRVCAAHLRASARPDAERLSRFLLDAGERLEALAPLHAAITERLARGDYRSAALLKEAEEAARAVGLPEADPRWGDLWVDHAWFFQGRGDLGEAERWFVRAERAARRHGWREVLARSLRMAAMNERRRGRIEEALDLCREAAQIFAELRDEARGAVCKVLEGDLLIRSDVVGAAAVYRSALAMHADPQRQVDAWKGLANCAQRQKDWATARMCLSQVRETAARAKDRAGIAYAANLAGEIARKSGDAAAAEAAYREAYARYKALDDAEAVMPALNLGLLLVQRSAWDETLAAIAPLAAAEERAGGQTVPHCFARSLLLAACAGKGDWDGVEAHLQWMEAFLEVRTLFDPDLERMASTAGRSAQGAHRRDLAVRAWRLARAQAQGTGSAAGTAAADAALVALGERPTGA